MNTPTDDNLPTVRFTAKLRQMFPIYDYIGLSVAELGNALHCRVPMQGSNANHFGAMHAGVLFSSQRRQPASR